MAGWLHTLSSSRLPWYPPRLPWFFLSGPHLHPNTAWYSTCLLSASPPPRGGLLHKHLGWYLRQQTPSAHIPRMDEMVQEKRRHQKGLRNVLGRAYRVDKKSLELHFT